MRIALTHAYSWPEVRRGAERIIRDLGRALAMRGNEVVVFSSGHTPGRQMIDGFTMVRTRRWFPDAPRHEKSFALQLSAHLTTKRFDCVHSLSPYDALASIYSSRVRKHRTVYTDLGLPERSWWDNHPAAKAHDRIVRDIDVYGAMSTHALRILEQEYGRKGTLTPGGVSLASFTPAPERERNPTILFSAALDEPRKGGLALVRALDIVLRSEPTARLWLSGPGSPASIMEAADERVRDRIDVLGLGDPEAQADRYGRAWVTALPSKYDSFGLVVIESLACGTPVAASNHAALPELIGVGETGYLCDPNDPASIADAIVGALQLARRSDIIQTCRDAAALWDWDSAIAPGYERIYAGADEFRREGS